MLTKIFYQNKSLFIFFLLFIAYYFFNFDYYNNLSANDYNYRYKPNGKIIISNLSNLDFININYFNFYFVPELITGILHKLTLNENSFSIASNFLNIVLLFFSFRFFLGSLETSNKEGMIFIFLIFFFIYIGNWVWCFWKLADVYFLFIFSLVFKFLINGIKKKNINFLLISLIIAIISLFSKPQGVAVFSFFLISVVLFFFDKKINFFKSLLIFFIIYLFLFPLIIFYLKSNNHINEIVTFMSNGNISGILFYKYDQFLNQFSLDDSNLSEILYFYFLFIKKIIYQITFIRETYSFNHNIFLIVYALFFYFFLIINLKYLLNEEKTFLKLTILINLFSILLHSSLGTADEPNRHQLFNLVPLYILASISFYKFFKSIKTKIKL